MSLANFRDRTHPVISPEMFLGLLVLIAATIGAMVGAERFLRPTIWAVQTLADVRLDEATGTVADLPKRLQVLNGKEITIEGEMYAPGATENWLRDFDLISRASLSQHHTPVAQDFIVCHSARPVGYFNGLVRATGILHIDVSHNDQAILTSVYRLDVDKVEPVLESASP